MGLTLAVAFDRITVPLACRPAAVGSRFCAVAVVVGCQIAPPAPAGTTPPPGALTTIPIACEEEENSCKEDDGILELLTQHGRMGDREFAGDVPADPQ
jgi:hypothetical protein